MDQKLASMLRKKSAENELTYADIIEILTSDNKKSAKYKLFSKGQLDKYIDKFKSPEEMEKAVIDFLEAYE